MCKFINVNICFRIGFVLAGICWFTIGCNIDQRKRQSAIYELNDRRKLFARYIKQGNIEYARKEGFESFRNSLIYFDSAQAIAEGYHDTMMLANAAFARGRVYDAWNKEPLQTVYYFGRAAGLLATQGPAHYAEYVYLRQLLAHAYEKIGDTVHAVAALRRLYPELSALPVAQRDTLRSISEMALVATKVGAWELADSFLQLTRRELIRNDPETYNYLDHYYLSRARLDVFRNHITHSPYLDSLEDVYGRVPNLIDRIYYATQLYQLYAGTGDYKQALCYLRLYKNLDDRLNGHGDLSRLQQALIASEVKAGHRQLAYESSLSRSRVIALWAVTFLLFIIMVLAAYLYQRNKEYRLQSLQLNDVNDKLDAKVQQVELLNKEIQHRVKNNLSMVYSLLYLQERRATNAEVIADLQTARLRVESIALLHGQLQEGPVSLDLTTFVRDMVSAVGNCFASGGQVKTELSIEPITLPANSLQAVSLILNEWVTNAIKYAADETEQLKLHIDIRREQQNVCITFKDNGGPAANATPGLGTQIVQLLCRQLRGRLSSPDGHPYHYKLVFPE